MRFFSFSPLLLLAAAGTLAAGCAESATTDIEEGTSEAHVQVASAVVVAAPETTASAEVLPDSIRLSGPLSANDAKVGAGTIFVGARGASTSKNPDGFLRRVTSVRKDGDSVVLSTESATLTDAILSGAVRASSSGNAIDPDALGSRRDLAIDIDFSKKTLFENVDEIVTDEGTTQFTETIVFDQAKLFARPSVDLDLRIAPGKVTRFSAKVEGQLDAAITARAEVKATGVVSEAAIAGLRGRHHEVRKVLYKSKRIPLPTFSVGRVPVSPAIEFTVTMKCDLSFGGPLLAEAGVLAKSYVRLAAVQSNGVWAPGPKSDFDIRPSFNVERGGEVDARCALEADAELSAYGTGGVTMTIAPYVDFGIQRHGAGDAAGHRWTAGAGALGSMRGQADVFGLSAVEQPIAEWTASPLTGDAP